MAEKRVKPPCQVPAEVSTLTYATKQIFITALLTIFSPYLLYITATKWNIFSDTYQKSQRTTIKENKEYQSEELCQRVWNDVAGCGAAYYDAVEYQKQEGWCGSATMRSVLKSLVALGQMSADKVPAAKGGPMTAQRYASLLDETSGCTKSSIVSGSDGYDAFRKVLPLANSTKHRLSLNFLRSSVFGAPGTVFYPPYFMKVFFGGHFSPIVAYLEQEDLVAVFDVNHAYGLFFVPSQRLYDSILTTDVQSGVCRGVVVTELV